MKIAGILLVLFGALLFLGGAAVGVTLALSGPPARCDAVEFANRRVETASRELAAAAGSPRQRELQEKANEANSLLRQAMGYCDEAWTERYITMGVGGAVALIGGVMFILGLIVFFIGRRRAKRVLV